MSETPSTDFTLYPAIDVMGGACVRLHKGDYTAKTEYSRNPAEVAKRWVEAGSKWLHVVDLDGAKTGSPVNTSTIAEVVRVAAQAGVCVQVGGGIRLHDDIARWLEMGVARCIIGTAALEAEWMMKAIEKFGGESLVVGLDGRDGRMAVRGWVEQTDVPLVDVAVQLQQLGVARALVTDVNRDGTLEGANISLARQVQDTGLRAIASGGIRNLEDVLAAKKAGLAGAIAGKSIYDGTLDVGAAICALGG
jgi:phosphoribosylformimino-5-aminoimidazole carboxamide ribotide isomerase